MCKRTRPKFNVGDILEDFYYHKDTGEIEIFYWLVAERVYNTQSYPKRKRRKKHTRRPSVIAKKRKNKKVYYVEWQYFLKCLSSSYRGDKEWTVECRQLDGYMSFKKVG